MNGPRTRSLPPSGGRPNDRQIEEVFRKYVKQELQGFQREVLTQVNTLLEGMKTTLLERSGRLTAEFNKMQFVVTAMVELLSEKQLLKMEEVAKRAQEMGVEAAKAFVEMKRKAEEAKKQAEPPQTQEKTVEAQPAPGPQ